MPQTGHKAEILIIGAGAIGVCAAYYLVQQGRTVMLLDKGQICSGSSYGNAGLIVPSHSIPLASPGALDKGLQWMLQPESPFFIKPRLDVDLFDWLWRFRRACTTGRMRRAIPVMRDLQLASLRLFKALAAVPDLDFGFEQEGVLELHRTAEGHAEDVAAATLLQEFDLKVQVLNQGQVREHLQGIRTMAMGGLYYPQNAHVNPYQFVRALAAYLTERGVLIQTDTEVLSIEATKGQIRAVSTTRGDISAELFVLASGAWSNTIARDMKIRLRLQPAKGYSITYKRPPEAPSMPLMLAEARVAVTPMDNLLRVAGTLELAGLDLSINRRRVRAILNSVPRYLPDLQPDELHLVEIWRGLRPCTPDGLPYLGRSHRYHNLVVAAGHGTLGISMAPISGRIVAQLVAGQTPAVDLSALDIHRFG